MFIRSILRLVFEAFRFKTLFWGGPKILERGSPETSGAALIAARVVESFRKHIRGKFHPTQNLIYCRPWRRRVARGALTRVLRVHAWTIYCLWCRHKQDKKERTRAFTRQHHCKYCSAAGDVLPETHSSNESPPYSMYRPHSVCRRSSLLNDWDRSE